MMNTGHGALCFPWSASSGVGVDGASVHSGVCSQAVVRLSSHDRAFGRGDGEALADCSGPGSQVGLRSS